MTDSTRPLPAVGGGLPDRGDQRDTRARRQQLPRAVRVLDAVAVLLSGGLLLVGIALLLLQLIAPSALGGTGLARATGPGWGRIVAHIAVGAAGEVLVLLRRRLPAWARAAADIVVLVGVAAVLWFAWWQ